MIWCFLVYLLSFWYEMSSKGPFTNSGEVLTQVRVLIRVSAIQIIVFTKCHGNRKFDQRTCHFRVGSVRPRSAHWSNRGQTCDLVTTLIADRSAPSNHPLSFIFRLVRWYSHLCLKLNERSTIYALLYNTSVRGCTRGFIYVFLLQIQ